MLLWQLTERPLLVVTDGNQSAETLLELTETFFDLLIGRPEAGRPQLLPALDVLPGQNLSPHTEISEQRAIGLWRMAAAKVPITIAPVGSALLRTHAGDYYRRLAVELRIGEELPLETIEAHLVSIGYEKREPVEMTGEYSIRGGILDVFPAENARPLRIEFFGDEIESIRRFDVESQRSVMKLTEVEVLPLAEQPRIGSRLSRLGIRRGARRPARAHAARSRSASHWLSSTSRSKSAAPPSACGSASISSWKTPPNSRPPAFSAGKI